MFESDVSLTTQLLGYAAVAMIFISYQFNDRNKILTSLIIGMVLLASHQLLLGALAGAFANGLTIGRNILFRFKHSYPLLGHILWPFIFSTLLVLASVVFWQGWFSILPALAVTASTFALWANDPRQIRILSFLGPLLWIPYAVIIDSLPTLVVQIMIITSLLIARFRYDRKAQ